MQRHQVLVIEDDPAIRRGVVDALSFDGYDVLEAKDGEVGLEAALSRPVDLVLLDLILPGQSGIEVLKSLRESRSELAVIILTAQGSERDRIAGLKLGADDYVVKPFSVRELLARVEAVLRRAPQRPQVVEVVPLAGGLVDLARREVRFQAGTRVELSEREAELLAYLARHAGRAISREELLTQVWRLNPRGLETRTIDMHIARLREKLRDDPAHPAVILTVHGKGYLFARPVDKLAGPGES